MKTKSTPKIVKKLIKVTAGDIANGKQEDASWCPVALALRRAFLKAEEVSVAYDSINVYPLGVFHTPLVASTPRKVQDFIASFDGGRDVKPFSVNLTFKRLT